MRNILCILILLALVVCSCQSLESPKPPSKLIPEDSLVTILTDIALFKAAKGSFKKKMEIEKINPEAYILQTYGVDSITFAENNAWYAKDLKNYESIFLKVKTNIEQEQKILDKQVKKRDSIKKVKDSIERASKKLEKDSLTISKKDLDLKSIPKKSYPNKFKKTIPKRVPQKKEQFP